MITKKSLHKNRICFPEITQNNSRKTSGEFNIKMTFFLGSKNVFCPENSVFSGSGNSIFWNFNLKYEMLFLFEIRIPDASV